MQLVASFGVDHFGHNQWIVSFTGDANTSMGSRTGTITVANQTFTVTQAGGATTSAPSISAGGIVNALDYRAGGLAQGAFFTIFGSNLGPVVGQGVTAFPSVPTWVALP